MLLPLALFGLLIGTNFFTMSFSVTNMGHSPDDKVKDMKRLAFFVNNSIVALNNDDKEGALSNLLFASLLGLSSDQRFAPVNVLINESVYSIRIGDFEKAKNELTTAGRQLVNSSQ